MATTSSIGTSSRNYSTIGAWHSAFANGGWIGNCYNDSEFVENPTIGGTSATNYEILTAASGQSMFDNSANNLTYDVSKGVGIKKTTAYGVCVTLQSYVTLSRIGVCNTGQGNDCRAIEAAGFGTTFGVVIDRCAAMDGNGTDGYVAAAVRVGGEVTLTNTVVISSNNACPGIKIIYGNPVVIANCTIVAPTNRNHGGTAIEDNNNASTLTIVNTAVFGYSNVISANSATGSYNATDLSSLNFTSSNSLTSLTYASQFTGIDSTSGVSTLDYRLKSGTGLADAGTDASSYGVSGDIAGTARPSGSGWDIGAWELVSGPTSTYTLTAAKGAFAWTGQAATLTGPISQVSFVGQASAASTTVTVPAHVAGDLIVVAAFRSSSTTIPTLPSGFTTPTNGSGSGNTCAMRVGYKIATGTSDTSGTWTNATQLTCHVYRGATGVGACQSSGGSSATLSYPALTLTVGDGTSWIYLAGAHRTSTNVEIAPSGATLRSDVGSGPEACSFDTNGGVGSFATTTVGVTQNSGWRTTSLEILSNPQPVILTAGAGSFALSGQAATLAKASSGNWSLAAAQGAFGESGSAAALLWARRLASGLGGFALSAQAAVLTLRHTLVTGAGAFAETAIAAALKMARNTVAAMGSFAVTGEPAVFSYPAAGGPRTLSAAAGVFALSGKSAGLGAGRKIGAGNGGFALNGKIALLVRVRTLGAVSAQYSLAGQVAILRELRQITAAAGVFAWAGIVAALRRGRVPLSASAGALVFTGKVAGLSRPARLLAGPGVFLWSGETAHLLGWVSAPRGLASWAPQVNLDAVWADASVGDQSWSPETEMEKTWGPRAGSPSTWN